MFANILSPSVFRSLRGGLSCLLLAAIASGLLGCGAADEVAPSSLVAQSATPAFSVGVSAQVARVIVAYKDGGSIAEQHPWRRGASSAEVRQISQRRAEALGKRAGVAVVSGRVIGHRAQVLMAQGMDSATLAVRLSADPSVAYAVVDHRRRVVAVPNDPLFSAGPALNLQTRTGGPEVGQWYLRAPTDLFRSATNAQAAWARSTGAGVVVAVLDTGVLGTHADLSGQVLPGYDFVRDSASANDGDGRDADASDPGDWVSAAEDSSGPFMGCGASDSSWHGTQVAGIIAASANDGIGMAGLAHGAKILPVRVLGKCGGYDSDIAAGMLWAAGIDQPGLTASVTPAKVLNLSFGSEGSCTAVYQDTISLITARGAVVVAAAGNSVGNAVGAPANCPGVIGVAGLRHAGSKVGFSDLGPEVAIAAPGGNCVNIELGTPCLYPILTTSNSGLRSPAAGGSIFTDSFNISVGTSFAAPMVAATAALILSARPDLSPVQVKAALQAGARQFPNSGASNGPSDPTPVVQCRAPSAQEQLQCYCVTGLCGAGMLDAVGALAAAEALPSLGGAALGAVQGVAYHWKSGVPLIGVNVSISSASALQVGSEELFVLKGANFNTSSGRLTVEVWTNSSVPFGNFDFRVLASGATDISFISAMSGNWNVTTSYGTNSVASVAGVSLANASGTMKIGTLQVIVPPGQARTDVAFSQVRVGALSGAQFGFSIHASSTNTNGTFSFSGLQAASLQVIASRDAMDAGNAITSADALAALRIAVGLNPNPDPDGDGPLTPPAVSPYQLMAADVNGSGTVTSADALAILRMAVNLPNALPQEWFFVEESRILSLSRTNASWDRNVFVGPTSGRVNLIGVLKGDINGSWVPPAPLVTSILLDQLEPISGSVKLSLNGAVNGSVTWYTDLRLLGTGAATDGHSIAWNTVGVTNGAHQILARIQLATGGVSEVRRTVVVSNSEITLKATVSGVTGLVNVDVLATAPTGIKSVSARFDGLDAGTLVQPNACSRYCSGVNDVYRFVVDAAKVKSGSHSMVITAVDQAGGTRSATVDVPISNPPILTLNAPLDGALVFGTLRLHGSFNSDKPGAVTVTAKLGDLQFLSTTNGAFSGSYDLTGVTAGAYPLTVLATDSTGQVSQIQRNIVVTSSAARAYTPVFTLPAGGQLLAAEGAHVLYARGDGTVLMRHVVQGTEVVLTNASLIQYAAGWRLDSGRTVAYGKGADCVLYCVYLWSSTGSVSNLTNANPYSRATNIGGGWAYDLHPVLRGDYVLWVNDKVADTGVATSATGRYTLHQISTGNFTRIGVPTGVNYVGNNEFDFNVSSGMAEVWFWGQTGGEGMTSQFDIFRWRSDSGNSARITSGGGRNIYPKADNTLIAWQQSPVGGSSDNTFILNTLSQNSLVPVAIASKVNSFSLRDGLLAWIESPTSASRALKVLSPDGNTRTLSTLSAAALLGTSGGHVAFTEGGKTYTWSPNGTLNVLRLDTTPGQMFLSGGSMVFTVGPSVYRVPLN